MIAFFGEPSLKQAVRHRIAEHRRLDQIIAKQYIREEDGRVVGGCFIGCSLHSSNHKDFEQLLGIPTWLAYLGEYIFECLDSYGAKREHLDFPLALYDAIPVGADLEPVREQFIRWAMDLFIKHAQGKHTMAAADVWRMRLAGCPDRAEEMEVYLRALSDYDAGRAGIEMGWLFSPLARDAGAAITALFAFQTGPSVSCREALAASVACKASLILTWRERKRVSAACLRQAAAHLIEMLRATAPVAEVTPELPCDVGFQAYRLEVMGEMLAKEAAGKA